MFMIRAQPQDCPRCGGRIAQDDCVQVRRPDCVEDYLHCEFCGYGIERAVYDGGDVLLLDYQRRTEPVCYGKFLQRLESARVA